MLRLAGLVAALVLACVSTPLVACAQAPSLNWGSQVNPSRCPTDAGYRYLEINVTRKVDDDVALYSAIDPGSGAWAVRDFNQHIQVWQVGVAPPPSGGERFCALVRYQGSFETPGGKASPGHTDDSVAMGVDGSFEGGYLLVFTADELASPLFKTQGHIGSDFHGPRSLYDWIPYYFEHYDVDVTTALPAPAWWAGSITAETTAPG